MSFRGSHRMRWSAFQHSFLQFHFCGMRFWTGAGHLRKYRKTTLLRNLSPLPQLLSCIGLVRLFVSSELFL